MANKAALYGFFSRIMEIDSDKIDAYIGMEPIYDTKTPCDDVKHYIPAPTRLVLTVKWRKEDERV